MDQPPHGQPGRKRRPEDSGVSSRRLRAKRGCQVSRAARHEGAHDPDKQPHHHQKQRPSGGAAPDQGHCTRYGTMHPIRGTAPVQKRCIAYGSGAAPQHTRTNAELANQALPTTTSPSTGHKADIGRVLSSFVAPSTHTVPERTKQPRPRPTGIGDEVGAG